MQYKQNMDMLSHIEIKHDFPLNSISFIKLGGNAKFLAYPKDLSELKDLIKYCNFSNNIPYIVIGNASNILFSDKGFDGFIISLEKVHKNISINGEKVRILGHVSVAKLQDALYNNSLTGLEFLHGIPGNILACALFNVGNKNDLFKDCLEYVKYLDSSANECILYKKDINFKYRTRILDEKSVLFELGFCLKKESQDRIKKVLDEYKKNRTQKQPLNKLSLGCTFKNPKGYAAGKLIQDAGLKGMAMNSIRVSEKHANFFINEGNGTSEDYLQLMKHVQDKVFAKFKVKLEPEIQILGEEAER